MKQANQDKLAKGRPIQLFMQDKHEPFGNLSIDAVKAALMDEDFSQMQSLFFYMMRDLKIASAVLTRSQQLVGQRYDVVTDNKAFKDWLTDNVALDDLVSHCASGIYYGMSLSDVRYTIVDHLLVPGFVHVSPRYMYADEDISKGQLKPTLEHLYIRQNTKKLWLSSFDPSRIVFHKHPIDIGEITDFSLASKLVWYFSLKHLALAHNLAYFDNVATPPLIAKSSGNEDALIDTLYTLKSACVGVFDKDDVVEYLKVDNKADFLAFIEYIDRQIATLILGNTLSTGEGKNGSRAQSEVHENRQMDILQFDARLIQKTITDYLNKLEKLNFANPKGCKFQFQIKQKKNLLDLSGVVKNLSDSGFVLDDKDIEEQFGFKILGKKSDQAATPSANAATPSTMKGNQHNAVEQTNSHRGKDLFGAFEECEKRALTPNAQGQTTCACCEGERGQGSLGALKRANQDLTPMSINKAAAAKPYDALEQQVQGIGTQKVENELVGGMLSVIAQAETYEQAYQSLLEYYPDVPLDELEATLFNNTANAHLLGVAEIEDEEKDA